MILASVLARGPFEFPGRTIGAVGLPRACLALLDFASKGSRRFYIKGSLSEMFEPRWSEMFATSSSSRGRWTILSRQAVRSKGTKSRRYYVFCCQAIDMFCGAFSHPPERMRDSPGRRGSFRSDILPWLPKVSSPQHIACVAKNGV